MAKELTILIVSNNVDEGTLKDGLRNLKDLHVRLQSATFHEGWDKIVEYKPNVVVFVATEEYEQYMELAKKTKAYYHGVAIFMISNNVNADYILTAYKNGVKDYFKMPYVIEDVQKALAAIYAENTDTEKLTIGNSRVISVFSNKGGIGVTTVATNLAAALAEMPDVKVLLCDFVFQHGDIAIFLETQHKCTVTDIITNMNRIDKVFLENTLARPKENLYVLHGPENPEEGDFINAAQLGELIQIFKRYFDYIVIDTSHNYNDSSIMIFDAADMILLLLTLELPSICNCGKTLEIFQKLRYERDKVKLVVNRTNARNQIDIQLVEDQLNYPIFTQLPNDYLTVVKGINNGQSVFDVSRGSTIATAMRGLRDQIMKEMNKEFPEEKKGLFDKLFKKK